MTLHEEFKFNRGETEWRIYFHGTKVNTQSFPWINAANSVIRLINTQFLTYGSGFTTYLRATHERFRGAVHVRSVTFTIILSMQIRRIFDGLIF